MKEQIFSTLMTSFTKLNNIIKEIDPIDFFYILSLLIIAISLFAIAYIAARFLSIWNREMKQKKRKLLASKIMESVYKLEDIFLKIRNPFYFPSEVEEILKDINEKHYFILHENKIKYLIPFYRIKKYKTDIDNFKKIQYKAQLYWKEPVFDLFKKAFNLIETIEHSSRILYECELSKEDKENHLKNIWNTKELDIINPQVQSIVKEFKFNLEKIYKPKRKSWKQIKQKKAKK